MHNKQMNMTTGKPELVLTMLKEASMIWVSKSPQQELSSNHGHVRVLAARGLSPIMVSVSGVTLFLPFCVVCVCVRVCGAMCVKQCDAYLRWPSLCSLGTRTGGFHHH